MPYHSMLRPRASFPFADLPADVQLVIMSDMDLHTLKNVTQAISSARGLYLKYSSSVLQSATARMGVQIQQLLLTTDRIIYIIKSDDMYNKLDLVDMEKFFEEHLDAETPKKIDILDYDPLGVLHGLCEIDAEVTSLVDDYANDIYEKACHRDNPGAITLPLQLSSTERHRLTRAFYRLKLFSVLFYNYADRFGINLEPSYTAFFARLCTFEIDELVTAYQFALRERWYFKSPYVHTGCSPCRLKPWTNRDPFNCETCHGFFQIPKREEYAEPRPWHGLRRPAQPFWNTASIHFLDLDGMWAEFDLCRPIPIKMWRDVPDNNGPGAGWTFWKEFYDRSGHSVSRQLYVNVFRTLGYCFWDSTRLEEWGNMFGSGWASEEIMLFHQV